MENLIFDFTTNPSLLTWSPPSFYSDDIPQGSITTYQVYVKSKDGSKIYFNTSNLFYRIPSNFTVCGTDTASVRAIIEQYKSLPTKTSQQNVGRKIISITDLISYCYIRL